MNNTRTADLTSSLALVQKLASGPIIIRMPEVEAITGLARPTIYKRLKSDSTFPRPVPLSDSKSRGAPVGWVFTEVQNWVRQRMALREEA